MSSVVLFVMKLRKLPKSLPKQEVFIKTDSNFMHTLVLFSPTEDVYFWMILFAKGKQSSYIKQKGQNWGKKSSFGKFDRNVTKNILFHVCLNLWSRVFSSKGKMLFCLAFTFVARNEKKAGTFFFVWNMECFLTTVLLLSCACTFWFPYVKSWTFTDVHAFGK